METIKLLQDASGALRQAGANLSKEEERRNAWLKESPEAFALRDMLVHDFLFAYRNLPDILSNVRSSTKGQCNADMVQHLANLGEIGREYKEELEAIGFDLSLLDKASALSARMGDILGEIQSGTVNGKNVRRIRLQAYTLLKNMMSEVSKYGKYVFYDDEVRYSGYTISYNAKKRRQKEEVTLEAEPQREAA